MEKSPLIILGLLLTTLSLYAQTPCENGMAGNYPCNNVDLMARLSPQVLGAEAHEGFYLNDIWGWTDSDTGKEYALVGMTNGTSFVDVTDPINPVVLGMLPEHEAASSADGRTAHDGVGQEAKSIWRDIKTFQHYAFIVSEDEFHGVQVFDLHQLRNWSGQFTQYGESAHYDGVGNAHNIVINEETGFAYAVGATKGNHGCSGGGLHVIDINDPLKPVYAGCFDNDGYTHDAQSVVYQGPDVEYQGKEIVFNSNENSVTIVDITDKGNMKIVSRSPYSGSSYTHQGWLTEDHKYFISNDELDEYYDLVDYTTTFIWDMSDLDKPVLINRYTHPRTSIDHNLYVKGDKIFQSNYTSGLVILNATNIESGGEVFEQAFFDTYPTHNKPEFMGTWSNYPYFESGNVVMTDMTRGLYVLHPNLALAFSDQPDNESICEGESIEMGVTVIGDVASYQWQIDTGEGFVDIEPSADQVGVDSDQLTMQNTSVAFNQAHLRCKVLSQSGESHFSEEVSLAVQKAPIADFEWEMSGTKVTFINLTEGAEQLSWDLGENGASEEETSIVVHHYPNEEATYEVTLTAINSCGSSTVSKSIAMTILGLEDNEFDFYPNPASDHIEVIVPVFIKQPIFRILTLEGKTLLTSSQTTFSIADLKPGIYLLQLDHKEGSHTEKLIVK